MVALLSAKRPKSKPSQIPAALIYEIIDGKPIYYNGYKAVLKGDKTIEDVLDKRECSMPFKAICKKNTPTKI